MAQTQESYNYRHFTPEQEYDFDTFPGPKPGQQFYDVQLQKLNNETVALSDFLDKPIVLEIGSMSCPVFTGKIEPMQELQATYPDMHFLVMYTREAHPGSGIPEHKAFQDKLHHAQQLKKEYNESRTILVDSIDGDAHKAYGLYPNMLYIINTDGTIAYRAKWNDPEELKQVLEKMQRHEPLDKRESHKFVKPPKYMRNFLYTFWKSGARAMYDFIKALPTLWRVHANDTDNNTQA